MTPTLTRAAVAALALTLAAPAFAEGLRFLPQEPQGLDEAAMVVVGELQAGMPAQLGDYEASGFKAWGAIAVPQGVELKTDSAENIASWMVMIAGLEDAEAATSTVLELCQTQTGASCTLVGIIGTAE